MEARAVAMEARAVAMEARAVAAEADVQWLKSMINASANNSPIASAGPVVLAQSVEQDIRTMVRVCLVGAWIHRSTPSHTFNFVYRSLYRSLFT